MNVTLAELADLVGGTLIGNATTSITEVAPLHAAKKTSITFLTDSKKASLLTRAQPGAAIVPDGFVCDDCNLIQVSDVLGAIAQIAKFFRPPRTHLLSGISASAEIDSTAKIGNNVQIGAHAYLGADVVIGDNCLIYPGVVILDGTRIGDSTTLFANVVIYENNQIGKNCILHANSVIGAYGFGYDSHTGEHRLSPQLGYVLIEDDVEIGACSTVDRGTYGSTKIGRGTKIDNHVMIAHNCQIGEFNLICASSGIAGSVTTGDHVVMAGRVGIRDHICIGSEAVIGAMAGIMADVPEKARVVGIPATPEKEQMRKQVALAKLPEMRRELNHLQKTVETLLEKPQ